MTHDERMALLVAVRGGSADAYEQLMDLILTSEWDHDREFRKELADILSLSARACGRAN